jgi:hypothetical protein
VQHLDQRVHVLLVYVPEQAGVLLRRVQRQHVDVGGAVSEDEALVLCREGRFGIRLVCVVGMLDEDGLEIFDLGRVSALRIKIAGARALTSLFRLAQKLLLIYRLRPWSTTNRPKRVSRPSTLLSTTTLAPSRSRPLGHPPCSTPALPFGHPLTAVPFFSRSASCCSCSSTCPSSLRRRSMSSPSAGFLLLRGARPGPGKMHSIFARAQLEHGCFLSHFTLRLRHVTQDLGLNPAAPAPDAPLKLPPLGFETRSFALAGAACSTSSPMVGAVE